MEIFCSCNTGAVAAHPGGGLGVSVLKSGFAVGAICAANFVGVGFGPKSFGDASFPEGHDGYVKAWLVPLQDVCKVGLQRWGSLFRLRRNVTAAPHPAIT